LVRERDIVRTADSVLDVVFVAECRKRETEPVTSMDVVKDSDGVRDCEGRAELVRVSDCDSDRDCVFIAVCVTDVVMVILSDVDGDGDCVLVKVTVSVVVPETGLVTVRDRDCDRWAVTVPVSVEVTVAENVGDTSFVRVGESEPVSVLERVIECVPVDEPVTDTDSVIMSVRVAEVDPDHVMDESIDRVGDTVTVADALTGTVIVPVAVEVSEAVRVAVVDVLSESEDVPSIVNERVTEAVSVNDKTLL